MGFTPLVDLVGLFPDQVLGRFAVPLLLGILGCAILLLTPPLGARGTADLTRRSMFTTGPRASFVIVAAALALMIGRSEERRVGKESRPRGATWPHKHGRNETD